VTSEAATDFWPADIGKLSVEDDQVRPGIEGTLPGLRAGECPDDLIALGGKNAFQAAGGPFLVVGDQDARSSQLVVAIARHDEACQQQESAECRT